MHFYILMGQTVVGPLSADEIRHIPGLTSDTPVCPENRDHTKSGSWSAMSSFSQLLPNPAAPIPEKDDGVSRFWKSALAKERMARVFAAALPCEKKRTNQWFVLLALAALPILFSSFWLHEKPQSRPEPSRNIPVASPLDQAVSLCTVGFPPDEVKTLHAMAEISVMNDRQEIIIPADGRNLMAEARFVYNTKLHELRPSNDVARGLLDIRKGYLKR